METPGNSETDEKHGGGSSDSKQARLTDMGAAKIDFDETVGEKEHLDSITEELFPDEDPIFSNKNLLQISHVPEGNRIVGRKDQIQRVGNALADATRGAEPENLVIHGRTGTGKSLVAKYVTRLTQYKVNTSDRDVTIGAAYIDCKTARSPKKLAQMLGSVLNDEEQTGVYFPDHGLGYDTYVQRIWSVLDTMYDVVIIILDEMDKHKDSDTVLSTLSRAGEDEHITQCNLGLVIISNRSQWVKRLEQRTGSGLQTEPMVFSAYNEQQLTDIMEHRKDAFHEGVLDDGVIPLVAEYAAEEHGDARRALDILRNAGKIARDADARTVGVEHVHDAADYAEKGEVQDHIGDEPPQPKLVLLAMSILAQETGDIAFTNADIHRVYNGLAEHASINTLSQRRVIDILDELNFFEIIHTKMESGGYQRGSVAHRTLVYSPEIIEEVVIENNPEFAESRDAVMASLFDYLVDD